jgi:hypothetical protein
MHSVVEGKPETKCNGITTVPRTWIPVNEPKSISNTTVLTIMSPLVNCQTPSISRLADNSHLQDKVGEFRRDIKSKKAELLTHSQKYSPLKVYKSAENKFEDFCKSVGTTLQRFTESDVEDYVV